MLPRATIFGNPDRIAPCLSHDGKQLAWSAPKDDVMNVFVAPVSDMMKAVAVADEHGRPISQLTWAWDNKHVLYALDKNGDENTHVFNVDVDVAAKTTTDITPSEKIQGRISGLSERFPTQVLLSVNARDAKYHDLYKVDLVSGERKLLQKNEGGYADFIIDDSFAGAAATAATPRSSASRSHRTSSRAASTSSDRRT